MIDIHTHLLPNFDDGARSVEEARNLIGIIKEQGFSNVVLSSHFYTDRETCDAFCTRYDKAYTNFIDNNCFDIKPLRGAEVSVGINFFHLPPNERLLIEGTQYILLELPFCDKLPDWVYYGIAKELTYGYIPIIAHVEKYPYFSLKIAEKLKNAGALLQVNASSLTDTFRRRAMKLFKKNHVDFLASDTHNEGKRPPKFDSAFDILEKKFGLKYVEKFKNDMAELME